MSHSDDPQSASAPLRKNQVAKKSTAKASRNLKPSKPLPSRSSTVEIITLDSDQDQDDVKFDVKIKIEAAMATPKSESANVDKLSLKTEPTAVKREVSGSEDEDESLIIIKPELEPVSLTVAKSDPGDSVQRSRSTEEKPSPYFVQSDNRDHISTSPPPHGRPLKLPRVKDGPTEAERTLEEVFAQRRRIQEARLRCQQEGIPLRDPTSNTQGISAETRESIDAVVFRPEERKRELEPIEAIWGRWGDQLNKHRTGRSTQTARRGVSSIMRGRGSFAGILKSRPGVVRVPPKHPDPF